MGGEDPARRTGRAPRPQGPEGVAGRDPRPPGVGHGAGRRPAGRRPTGKDGPKVGRQHGKTAWKPGNVLSPAPAVLVSCGGTAAWPPNLLTVAWAGNVCSEPAMLSISVRPERHSYSLIAALGEFVVNVPSAGLARAVDWCGVVSGRDLDKFAGAGLTPGPALKVRPPIVRECPLNIECRVRTTLALGSHTLFVAEVVAVQVTEALIDAQGRLRIEAADPLAYAHGHYFSLGREIGHFGFSVRKRRGPPRR